MKFYQYQQTCGQVYKLAGKSCPVIVEAFQRQPTSWRGTRVFMDW